MQTLSGVVQQQTTTRDNLTRMMEQCQGQQGGIDEFKRLNLWKWKWIIEPMEAEMDNWNEEGV